MRIIIPRFCPILGALFLYLIFTDLQAQVSIYAENFDARATGAISFEHQDSWQEAGTSIGFLNEKHLFGIHAGGQSISGQSLGISYYDDENLVDYFGFQYTSCTYNTSFDLAAYKVIPTSGYENIQLEFEWKGMGQNLSGNWVDYGQVGYSTTGGPPFIWLDTGGFSGDGLYHSQTATQNMTVSFPAEAANQNNFTLAFRSKANNCGGVSPQFIIDNLVLLGNLDLENHSLLVSNAFGGASHADGNYQIENNTTLTLTSGSLAGYEVTGWNGSGSVPASGSAGTVTINLLEDSEIHWNWAETLPVDISFQEINGDELLTFNNSRAAWEAPIFKLVHGGDTAGEYEIEINSAADFTGTSWVQHFPGTFPENAPTIFIFDNGFLPENGTTYYVRARAKGVSHGLWSNWNILSHSFTHLAEAETDWFQTTQNQFQSNENLFTEITASGEVKLMNFDTENFQNGSFENLLNNWTIQSNPSANYVADISEKWAVDGNYSAEFYNINPFTVGYMQGDYIDVHQVVDLTGISHLRMTAKYEGGGAMNIEFRVYVGDTDLPEEEHGTLVFQWQPESNFTTEELEIVLTPFGFSGDKRLKLMYYVNAQQTGFAQHKILNLDHVRTVTAEQAMIHSTAISLASVPETTAYESLSWNQIVDDGSLILKIQERAGEIWSDVASYDSISIAGNGLKTISLADMPAYNQIRLVGIIKGENVALQDWSVQFNNGNCISETIWDGFVWSNGIPNDPTVKIIMEGDFLTDELNTVNHELIGCSMEVLSGVEVTIGTGYNLILDRELVVDDENGAVMVVENDANLLQINPVQNQGKITLKREASVPSVQYNYWASPVANQLLYELYDNIPNNRVMRYNTQTDYFYVLPKSGNPTSEFGIGYSIKGPSVNPDAPLVTAEFFGVPNNDSMDEEDNSILLSTVGNGFNLIGNPYPSNLNLSQLYFSNESQFYMDETENTPAFYFWDNTNNNILTQQGSGYEGNNYAIYNPFSGGVAATGGDNMKKPNGIVKPGQGFIIKAAADAGYLQLSNSMRTTATVLQEGGDEAVYYKNQDAQETAVVTHPKFWLELVNPTGVHIQIAIGYFDEADNGFEKYDSPLFNESVSENIYSFSKDGKKLAIQGRKGPFLKSDAVPLGVKIANPGKYKIQLEDRLGIFNTHQTIYLRDKLTQTVHNLSESAFEWGAEPGEITDRFEIIYQDGNQFAADLALNQLEILKKDNHIEINSSRDKIQEVEIFNMSGWSLYQNSEVNQNSLRISSHLFGKQIIILTGKTETGEIFTKKLMVK